MKARRHARVLELIKDQVVETQEDLVDLLAGEGMRVTQATISRDIKELRLVKLPMGNGRSRYALPQERAMGDLVKRLQNVLHDSVVSIDFAEFVVLIKTLTGNAHAVAAALDAVGWEEVVGTLAGDDTILLIARRNDQVPAVLQRLSSLRG